MKKLVLLIVITIFIVAYAIAFYPRQMMPVGMEIKVETPELYKNDCLHPTVRKCNTGGYYMSQSPYYSWRNKYENPFFYHSNSLYHWQNGLLLSNTPKKGFNSDPNFIIDGDRVFYIWRECGTPLCDSLSCCNAIVGGYVMNDTLDWKRVIAVNKWREGDYAQCPVLLSKDDNGRMKYLMYSAWYQYEPERTNKGMAVWEGYSFDNPDFQLIDTIKYDNFYTVIR